MRLAQLWPALNAFLIALVYIPGIVGSATSGRWAIASLSLFYMRFWPLCFAVYCFLMMRLDHAMHWAIVCAAFSWGTRCNTKRVVTLAFATGIAVSGVIAGFQYWAGFDGISQAAVPAGLFVNKNMLGEAACLALIACARERVTGWTISLMLMLGMTVALSHTRAAWFAILLCLLWYLPLLWRSFSLMALLACGYLVLDHQSLDKRLMLWQTFKPSWFGNGDWWFNTLQFDAYDHMHNDWLQLVHELGVAGLVPIVVLLYVFFCARDWSQRAFCIALLTIGFFGFPLQMPATAWFAAFVLGTYFFIPNAERRISLRESVSAIPA